VYYRLPVLVLVWGFETSGTTGASTSLVLASTGAVGEAQALLVLVALPGSSTSASSARMGTGNVLN
jgi:hypothetical protein